MARDWCLQNDLTVTRCDWQTLGHVIVYQMRDAVEHPVFGSNLQKRRLLSSHSRRNKYDLTHNAVRIDEEQVLDASLVLPAQHVLTRRVGALANQEVTVDSQQALHLKTSSPSVSYVTSCHTAFGPTICREIFPWNQGSPFGDWNGMSEAEGGALSAGRLSHTGSAKEKT